MADIVPPGFAQVTVALKHTALTRQAAVVFGVDAAGQPDPDLLAESIDLRFRTHLGPRIDSEVQIGPVSVSVGQDGGEPTLGSTSATTPGGRSGTSEPPQVAVLLKKRSARGGRRGQGRMYLPWAVNDGSISEAGVITTADVTQITGAATAFLDALASDATPMVILHSLGSSDPGSPNVVTSLICDPVVATQRRRLGRR